MPMYIWLQYSSNYPYMTGSLWFYSKDEAAYFNANIVSNNNFKSFKYKSRLIGNTVADGTKWNFKKCNNYCAIKVSK